MTKRFDIDDSDIVVDDLETGESYIFDDYRSCENCCILLNELHSRNKRLEEKIQRERNSFRKTHERWSKEAENKIKDLSDENNQLKTFLESLREELSLADRDNTALEKENEECKMMIATLRNIILENGIERYVLCRTDEKE